jgi:cell division protease FtsH
VDIAVRNMLEAALERATAVLTSRRADLEAAAMLVLERETITADDFPALAASGVAFAA